MTVSLLFQKLCPFTKNRDVATSHCCYLSSFKSVVSNSSVFFLFIFFKMVAIQLILPQNLKGWLRQYPPMFITGQSCKQPKEKFIREGDKKLSYIR